MKLKYLSVYFTTAEKIIWSCSVFLILASFCLFDRVNYFTLIASIIGVTSLIFNAKGNPFGQFLIIIFSIIYGMISFKCAYYGEMITYLGMTVPMALVAFVSWLRHPYNKNKSEVKVNSITVKDIIVMIALTILVTILFYFILKYFNTQNLIPSTISVTTSFVAVYLTYCRSPYFALAYAANDIVLIVLWVMADGNKLSYISVVICFVVFLVNDIYSFIAWRKMQKRQKG